MTPFKVGICGTTQHTVWCAQALASDDRFEVAWIVTPTARPVGRKQIVTPTPLEIWGRDQNYPIFNVEKSLKPLKETLGAAEPIDYLLVVDFGYLVPDWLITLPRIAPINIHPSDLPRYRGSSPGQFVLLAGEKSSAVSIMRLTAGLDEGPIIARLPLEVTKNETQTSYYTRAFQLAQSVLADTLNEYSRTRQEFPQPDQSPTPIAGRLSREDGFVPWSEMLLAFSKPEAKIVQSSLEQYGKAVQALLAPNTIPRPELIHRLIHAFSPWPGCWTTVPEYEGRTDVRLKLLESSFSLTTVPEYEGRTDVRLKLLET